MQASATRTIMIQSTHEAHCPAWIIVSAAPARLDVAFTWKSMTAKDNLDLQWLMTSGATTMSTTLRSFLQKLIKWCSSIRNKGRCDL